MWPTIGRLSELWYKQKNRPLSKDEETEMVHCLDAIMRKAQRLADLENKSLVASMVKDTEWQHEICADIEKIKCEMADMPH
jgi:hypothetical protein